MIEAESRNKIINVKNGGIKIPHLNIMDVKPKRNELIALTDAKNIDISRLQDTSIPLS